MSETLNKKKKFQMPTALSIVMIFLGIVAIMTWFVPTSVVNDAGEIVFNAAFDADGNIIENAGTNPAGLWDFFLAPIQGLALGADVAASIFVSGAMVAVLNKTGAMDSFISALLRKFSGNTLIARLIIIFALMGTVYGAWEELPAYAIIVVPMFLTAGYDAMTGILVILVGAVAGNMSDVVNPYAIGAAVAAIGNEELGMGSGIVLRMILFVVLVAFGIFMVLRYANKVKKDPSKSVVADVEEAKHMSTEATLTDEKMSTAHKWSIAVFAIVILLCVAGYAPWDSIGDGETVFNAVNAIKYKTDGSFIGDFLGMGTFCEFGWWYFNEFCV
ncbi:MAG: YfcC family protein, partial [Firmicutes bacterium]|nr:YfcC family protein [Bacillota bacterium]